MCMPNVRVSSRVKRELCVRRVMMRRPIGRFKAAQCSD